MKTAELPESQYSGGTPVSEDLRNAKYEIMKPSRAWSRRILLTQAAEETPPVGADMPKNYLHRALQDWQTSIMPNNYNVP